MATSKAGGRKAARTPGEEHLSRREGGSTWQIGFIIDGRRFRESSGTADKEAAGRLALARFQEEWDRIKLGIERVPEMTLNDAFVRYYRERGAGTAYGDGGQKYIFRVWLETLGPGLRLSELTDARVNGAIQAIRHRPPQQEGRGARKAPAAGGTINRYLAALSVVTKRAREVWGVAVGDWSPKQHKQREAKGREVFLDQDQARRLLGACVPHLRPILAVALMTGLRRENVLGLEWERVSLDMGRAVLMQKGGRPLGIVLAPDVVGVLRGLRPDPAERSGHVFVLGNPHVGCTCASCKSPRRKGERIRSVKRAFATAAAAAGLRDMPAGRLRFHDMRHTSASWLLGAGGDLVLVREALGHASIATTARYAHLLPGRKESVVAAASAGLLAAPERKKDAG